MGPKLRPRTRIVKPETYATAVERDISPSPTASSRSVLPSPLQIGQTTPPIYIIDLSLPPVRRYVEVANEYKFSLQKLQSLFDDLLESVRLPKWILHFVARLVLRKVYSKEQTEELRGISEVVELPMYLLVAYNVLLDLFMGCTSGGARVQPSTSQNPRMMHFRSLDWDMPELRDVIAQFDYVERLGGEVIARSVSYVGFVGMLTGLRQGLSVSLNFRPYHNNDTSLLVNVKFHIHQLAVLLGFRPSIASVLRDFILPRHTSSQSDHKIGERTIKLEAGTVYGKHDICTTLPGIPSTAAYLIFCTREETIILEKDRKTANILRSSSFVATTNHDVSYDTRQDMDHADAAHAAHAKKTMMGIGMEDVVEESIDRKRCLVGRWEKWLDKQKKIAKKRQKRSENNHAFEQENGVPLEELKQWMLEYPISNEQTHFVCVMNPAMGTFTWVRRYEEGEIGEDSDGQSDATSQ
jgi:hypothetical protein